MTLKCQGVIPLSLNHAATQDRTQSTVHLRMHHCQELKNLSKAEKLLEEDCKGPDTSCSKGDDEQTGKCTTKKR